MREMSMWNLNERAFEKIDTHKLI